MAIPVVIQALIDIIGHGSTMALVEAFGGQALRIPKTASSDQWDALVEVIGEPAMVALAKALGGGEPLYIAHCQQALKQDRNRKMIGRFDALLQQGLSARRAVSVLVREFRPISNRQVEKILNSPLPEPSTVSVQAELF